jgi:hypothetical protein
MNLRDLGVNEADDEPTSTSCSTNENHIINEPEFVEKEKATIEVVGMELSARCENGQLWKKQSPVTKSSTNDSIPPPETTPQEIILPTNVPINARILVTDAHTENVADEPSVILESKVTLNVIAPERVSNQGTGIKL